MFRRKTVRFFLFLVIGALLVVVGAFFYKSQKESRDLYISVKDGKLVSATAYEMPNAVYNAGEKNKYLFTFVAHDGVTYAASTLNTYADSIKNSDNFRVYYAVNGDGSVRLNGDGRSKINGEEYPIALSFEAAYFDANPAPPSAASGIIVLVIAGGLLAYAFYHALWLFIYKNVEAKGTLTYGVFVSAGASKFGSAKYMSVIYRYQTVSGEWIEAKTPYTFSGVDAEKLMLLETFKIRYKGKRSVIAENLRGLRI